MEKILFFIVVISISTLNLFGQNNPDLSSKEEVDSSSNVVNVASDTISIDQKNMLVNPNRKPQFPGGDDALHKFVMNEMRYPTDARKAGITGIVIVSFVIQKDGTLEDIRVVRGVYPSLDAEAIRIIKKMPSWSPGSNNGKSVKVKYTYPVKFKLLN